MTKKLKFTFDAFMQLSSSVDDSNGSGSGGGGKNQTRPASSPNLSPPPNKRRVTGSPNVGIGGVTEDFASMSPPSNANETSAGTTGGSTTASPLPFSPANNFRHPDHVIKKVISLLQKMKMKKDIIAKVPSHHANGLVPDISKIVDEGTIKEILKNFSPLKIGEICKEGYDCNLTSPHHEEVKQRDAIHEDDFCDTLYDIGCGYHKSLSGTKKEWSDVYALMNEDPDKYSDEFVEMIGDALDRMDKLELEDDDWYTLIYIGESAFMSYHGRAVEGKYPDEMYQLATLLGRDVVETKVSSATAFEKPHSLFVEAFLATLMMAATDETRRLRKKDVPCYINMYKGGDGFNRVRCGVRESPLFFSSTGNALGDFLKYNYKNSGHIEVFGTDFTLANMSNSTRSEHLTLVQNFVKDYESQIRAYIGNTNKREKTGRDVITDPNHEITIMDVGQYFGYYVGTKNVELCRGIFSKEYIRQREEESNNAYNPLLHELKEKDENWVTITDNGNTMSVLAIPKMYKGKDMLWYVRRIWALEENDDSFWVKKLLKSEGFDFDKVEEAVHQKGLLSADEFTAAGKKAVESTKAVINQQSDDITQDNENEEDW